MMVEVKKDLPTAARYHKYKCRVCRDSGGRICMYDGGERYILCTIECEKLLDWNDCRSEKV